MREILMETKRYSSASKLYDECLELECEIMDGAEEIGELRNKFYRQRNLEENIKFILPVLNTIIKDAENYKDFIEKVLEERNGK